jgi:hypothetical protein
MLDDSQNLDRAEIIADLYAAEGKNAEERVKLLDEHTEARSCCPAHALKKPYGCSLLNFKKPLSVFSRLGSCLILLPVTINCLM